MQTLIATARNHSLHAVTRNGKVALVPCTEVILMVSEPVYTGEADGDITKSHPIITIRFDTTAESLRELSNQCNDWADELEEMFGDAYDIKPDLREDSDIDDANDEVETAVDQRMTEACEV